MARMRPEGDPASGVVRSLPPTSLTVLVKCSLVPCAGDGVVVVGSWWRKALGGGGRRSGFFASARLLRPAIAKARSTHTVGAPHHAYQLTGWKKGMRFSQAPTVVGDPLFTTASVPTCCAGAA